MEKLEDKKKPSKRKDKFFSAEEIEQFCKSDEGLSFKAKLIGLSDVTEIRGDNLCETTMFQLKSKITESKQHKQKINIVLCWDTITITDEKNEEKLHTLPLSEISFVWKDNSDNRSIGLIVVRKELDTKKLNPKFYAYKTEKMVMILIKAMKTLFYLKENEKRNSTMNEGADDNATVDNCAEGDKFSPGVDEKDQQFTQLIDISLPVQTSTGNGEKTELSLFKNSEDPWGTSETFDQLNEDWPNQSTNANDPWNFSSQSKVAGNDPWLNLTEEKHHSKNNFPTFSATAPNPINFANHSISQSQNNFSNNIPSCTQNNLLQDSNSNSGNSESFKNPFTLIPNPTNTFPLHPHNSMSAFPVYPPPNTQYQMNPFMAYPQSSATMFPVATSQGIHINSYEQQTGFFNQNHTIFSSGITQNAPPYAHPMNSNVEIQKNINGSTANPQLKKFTRLPKPEDHLFDDLIPKDSGLSKTGGSVLNKNSFIDQFAKTKDQKSLNDLAKPKMETKFNNISTLESAHIEFDPFA